MFGQQHGRILVLDTRERAGLPDRLRNEATSPQRLYRCIEWFYIGRAGTPRSIADGLIKSIMVINSQPGQRRKIDQFRRQNPRGSSSSGRRNSQLPSGGEHFGG